MRYCCITLVLILLLGLVPFVALYGQTAEITEIGSFYSGYGNLIAYQSSGDYAYVLFVDNPLSIDSSKLLVFLLDEFLEPTEVNKIGLPIPGQQTNYRKLALEGQRLAVVSDRILLLYDISNPSEPVLSSSQSCQGTTYGAILMGDYLITLQDEYLRTYSINTPSSISLSDSIFLENSRRIFPMNQDIVVDHQSGPCKVVHLNNNGTFDDPLTLNHNFGYPLKGVWNNLAIYNDSYEVHVYDLSDLQNPIFLYDIWSGPIAYASAGVNVLDGYLVLPLYHDATHMESYWAEIYDITGTQPLLLGTDNQVSISTRWVTDGHNRLIKIDSGGTFCFVELSQTPLYGTDLINCEMNSISAGDNVIYAGVSSGVLVVDPLSPDINLETIEVEEVTVVAARGGLMVTSSSHDDPMDPLPPSIRIWDVSNPTTPILQSSFSGYTYSCNNDIRFDGDIMLLVSMWGGISLYDISDPQEPILLGWPSELNWVYKSDLSGSFLYLTYDTNASNNLRIYQWSAGETPVQVASLNLASRGMKLDEVDGKLFVSTNDGHLLVYDVTNPNSPQLISDTDLGCITDFAVKDDALVVLGNSAVRVYGITPAGLTELVASHIVPESSAKLAIHDNMVYVQEGYRLIYLDCTAAFNATVSNSEHSIPSPVIRLSAYPNPFSGATTLSFDLKSPERVQMSIYNIRGQKLLDILDTNLASGSHQIAWDGRDASGKSVSTGIYFCRLKAGGREVISRMAVVH